MKKFISFALIAALVATSAFAGFSGNAELKLGFDTHSKNYGFTNGKTTALELELAAETAEVVGEGDIYAGIKATMNVKVAEKAVVNGNGVQLSTPAAKEKLAIGANLSISEAYVTNGEWKVSILGAVGAPDYAKSAIDTQKTKDVKDAFGNVKKQDNEAKTWAITEGKQPGVTVEYKGFKAGVGFAGNATENHEKIGYSAFVEAPAFTFDNGSVQVAAYSAKANEENSKVAAGASVKADIDVDALCIKAAVDAGYDQEAFSMDAAATAAYDFVTVDGYYYMAGVKDGDPKHFVSADAKFDLNSFEVPVKVTVTGKDLTNDVKGQDLSAKVEATVSAEVSCDATVGYVLSTKKISASANVKYAPEAFTAKAGVAFSKILEKDNTTILSATASIETTKLVNGATLALAYGKDACEPTACTMNFLKDQTAEGGAAQNFGAVTASCKIAF